MNEILKTVCQNPWCKSTFCYTEEDMTEIDGVKIPPKMCKMCQSFDTELSGGITWSDKKYDGDLDDKLPHQIIYKVTNYRK